MAGDHWSCAAGDNKLARFAREAKENKRLKRIIAEGIAEGLKKVAEEAAKEKRDGYD